MSRYVLRPQRMDRASLDDIANRESPLTMASLHRDVARLAMHLAAVEEEREAEDAGDEELAREVTGRASHELRRELDAMTRIADEQRERAKSAERQLQECDHKLIEAEGCRDDWASRYGQAAQQLADMTRSRDDWKARRKSDAFGHEMAARWHAAERLAADALRIGLEECERLRAEHDAMRGAAQNVANLNKVLHAELAALKADREKVGEWWEVGGSVFRRGKVVAQSMAKDRGERVVHVTRWRKR